MPKYMTGSLLMSFFHVLPDSPDHNYDNIIAIIDSILSLIMNVLVHTYSTQRENDSVNPANPAYQTK